MTGGLRCTACGAESPAGSGFCRQCGKALGPPVDDEPVEVPGGGRIQWGWVAAGTGLILVFQIVINITITPLIVRKMVLDTPDPSPYGALGLVILLGAAVYFLVGMLVGRYSKGYTVREPAIASVAAAAINTVLSMAMGSGIGGGVMTMFVVFALLAALGYGGGIVGEKLQQRAEKGRRPGGA
ncbi:MAG: zinc ribbon domain-containing protein [Deltaproteobacteria bacterium]|nr:zinc ribbon domain-containing protein [Deltaproteobacteria bacterium]